MSLFTETLAQLIGSEEKFQARKRVKKVSRFSRNIAANPVELPCCDCKHILPISHFSKSTYRYRSYCNPCGVTRNKAYREKQKVMYG